LNTPILGFSLIAILWVVFCTGSLAASVRRSRVPCGCLGRVGGDRLTLGLGPVAIATAVGASSAISLTQTVRTVEAMAWAIALLLVIAALQGSLYWRKMMTSMVAS